jgi:hypothetical protein
LTSAAASGSSLTARTLDRLRALRGPGESYIDAFLRLQLSSALKGANGVHWDNRTIQFWVSLGAGPNADRRVKAMELFCNSSVGV